MVKHRNLEKFVGKCSETSLQNPSRMKSKMEKDSYPFLKIAKLHLPTLFSKFGK